MLPGSTRLVADQILASPASTLHVFEWSYINRAGIFFTDSTEPIWSDLQRQTALKTFRWPVKFGPSPPASVFANMQSLEEVICNLPSLEAFLPSKNTLKKFVATDVFDDPTLIPQFVRLQNLTALAVLRNVPCDLWNVISIPPTLIHFAMWLPSPCSISFETSGLGPARSSFPATSLRHFEALFAPYSNITTLPSLSMEYVSIQASSTIPAELNFASNVTSVRFIAIPYAGIPNLQSLNITNAVINNAWDAYGWDAVLCTKFNVETITSLDVDYLGPESSIPQRCLSSVSNLKYLRLRYLADDIWRFLPSGTLTTIQTDYVKEAQNFDRLVEIAPNMTTLLLDSFDAPVNYNADFDVTPFRRLFSLERLSLTHANFTGTLPAHLFSVYLPNLKTFAMGNSAMTGTIPWFGLKNLEQLFLTDSEFTSWPALNLSEQHGYGPSKLQVVDISGNRLVEIPDDVSLSRLGSLRVFSFGTGYTPSTFNDSLFAFHVPQFWAWANSSVQIVSGFEKPLAGTLPPVVRNRNLIEVDFTPNTPSGEGYICGSLPQWDVEPDDMLGAVSLIAPRNRLTGSFPTTWSDRYFRTVDLSYNYLNGSLPSNALFRSGSFSLMTLKLNNNDFDGSIAPSFGLSTAQGIINLKVNPKMAFCGSDPRPAPTGLICTLENYVCADCNSFWNSCTKSGTCPAKKRQYFDTNRLGEQDYSGESAEHRRGRDHEAKLERMEVFRKEWKYGHVPQVTDLFEDIINRAIGDMRKEGELVLKRSIKTERDEIKILEQKRERKIFHSDASMGSIRRRNTLDTSCIIPRIPSSVPPPVPYIFNPPIGNNCPRPSPAGGFLCVDGAWTAFGDITVQRIDMPSTGTVSVQGELTIIGSVVFTGLDSSLLYVTGCVDFNSSETGPNGNQPAVILHLSDQDIEKIEKQGKRKVVLVKADGTECETQIDLRDIRYQVTAPKSCKRLVVTVDRSSSKSLSLLFKVDSFRCNVRWIILGSAIGGVILIVALVITICAVHPKGRIHQCMARRDLSKAST